MDADSVQKCGFSIVREGKFYLFPKTSHKISIVKEGVVKIPHKISIVKEGVVRSHIKFP